MTQLGEAGMSGRRRRGIEAGDAQETLGVDRLAAGEVETPMPDLGDLLGHGEEELALARRSISTPWARIVLS